MPYEGEFATYRSIRRIAQSQSVKEMLERMQRADPSQARVALPIVNISEIQPSEWQPEWVFAVDGSHQEELVENGYPGAEVAIVTIAGVFINIAKIKELDSQRPVDPKLFRETEDLSSTEAAFPGCNIVLDSDKSPQISLRKALFEVFDKKHWFSHGESLLDTYEVLLKYKPADLKQVCPYAENGKCQEEYLRGTGTYPCQCSHANTLHSTDALRIHERMLPDSANGQIFGEIMQVLERVMVIHVLRFLEQKQCLDLLCNMGFVIDGPLAVFGQPAWLSAAIWHELSRINKIAKPYTNGQDLLMIGVEKSGSFVDHFERIDQDTDGVSGAYPSQRASLLTDEYIKKHIIFSDSSKPYGASTYFGRKFFYKTASGARLVASLPFLDDSHRDMSRAEPDQYPRLADSLGLLDQLVSSRYPNSISPLISAHAEAAIPLNLGSSVLEELVEKSIRRS